MQRNTKQTCTVSIYQNIKQHCPCKQQKNNSISINPAFTTSNNSIINPAVVIADCLFADFRHWCFNGCLCDMRHIRSKLGFGANTPQIADARP